MATSSIPATGSWFVVSEGREKRTKLELHEGEHITTKRRTAGVFLEQTGSALIVVAGPSRWNALAGCGFDSE